MQNNQSLVYPPSPYQLLDLLARLLTVGIFSTTGGAKAWFELFLMIAALFSCGYLIWWQAIFLIFILIFGTLAAGLLTLAYPRILITERFTSERVAVSTLNKISGGKVQEATYLSGDALAKDKDTLLKAAKILQEHPTLLEDLTQLKTVYQNIGQDYQTTQRKIKVEEEEAGEIERQRHIAEQERRRQEAELERRRQEAERQASSRLQQRRREIGFSGGHPPLNLNGILSCHPDYPIKITLNGTDDGYDGVIWKPEDGKQYHELKNLEWCFKNVEEARADNGKYKLRRPKNSKGYERP